VRVTKEQSTVATSETAGRKVEGEGEGEGERTSSGVKTPSARNLLSLRVGVMEATVCVYTLCTSFLSEDRIDILIARATK